MPLSPEKGIINTKQMIWLLFIIITSFTALQVPGLAITQAGRDTWLAVIAAWFLDVMLALVYAYMGIRFPGENCVDYSTTILGKIGGKIVGLLFILFFLIVSAYLMRGLAIYIGNVFLPRTPIEVILIGAYLVIGYFVRKGIEVIARMCEILGPLYLLSFILLFILAIPHVELSRLKPQFDQGLYVFINGTPLILTHYGICVAMGWYIALCNRPENGFLAKFSAASLGALAVGLVIVLSIGSFGLEQAQNLANPGLNLTRQIHISNYFERMEVLWMVIAIGAGIMTSVNAIWIFSLGMAQIVGLNTYKPLVYPAALCSFVLSLTSFPNNTAFLGFTVFSFPLIGLAVESGLEIFLFLSALILRKKGKLAPE
ncbi:MAG TPA: endospore germination permease [Bacillota bacterium]|nr:endospore germination permease [Bacillota bacterium]